MTIERHKDFIRVGIESYNPNLFKNGFNELRVYKAQLQRVLEEVDRIERNSLDDFLFNDDTVLFVDIPLEYINGECIDTIRKYVPKTEEDRKWKAVTKKESGTKPAPSYLTKLRSWVGNVIINYKIKKREGDKSP